MPFEYQIEKELVSVRGFGESSLHECIEALHVVMSDSDYQEHTPVIVDLSHISYTPSFHDLKEIGAISEELCQKFKSKIAVVVSGFLHFGLAKTLCGIIEIHGVKMNVFFREDTAKHWVHDA
ncbi:MAG: hypothetical protein SFU91_09340 [Chloroherpetonaceae bacterium]|nr:hypothetical protein [Chloroherpetonaceae bacterium]